MSAPASKTWAAFAAVLSDGLLLLAAVWLLLSGWSKAMDVEQFGDVLAAHGLVPHWLVGASAIAVPYFEILVAAVSLWIRMTRKSSCVPWLLCASGFFALGAYALALWWWPPAVPASCGCLGVTAPVEHWGPVAARNVGIAILLASSPLLMLHRVATSDRCKSRPEPA